MSTTDLENYYSNLLIMQYNGLPNASATIKTLVDAAIASNIEYQVKNGFFIASAVGPQLDILGGLIGVPRTLNVALPAQNYFSTVDSSAVVTTLDGFDNSDLAPAPCPWFFYGALANTSLWSMDDDTYRRMIQYMAKLNSLEYSCGAIGDFLNEVPWNAEAPSSQSWDVSSTQVEVYDFNSNYPNTPTNMTMAFYITQPYYTVSGPAFVIVPDLLVRAVLAMKALPVPSGVTPIVYLATIVGGDMPFVQQTY